MKKESVAMPAGLESGLAAELQKSIDEKYKADERLVLMAVSFVLLLSKLARELETNFDPGKKSQLDISTRGDEQLYVDFISGKKVRACWEKGDILDEDFCSVKVDSNKNPNVDVYVKSGEVETYSYKGRKFLFIDKEGSNKEGTLLGQVFRELGNFVQMKALSKGDRWAGGLGSGQGKSVVSGVVLRGEESQQEDRREG